MKRPSLQWYPDLHGKNVKVNRCSYAARGVWLELMGFLHGAEEYGVLRWPLAEVARTAKLPLAKLKELASYNVLKGGDTLAEPYVWRPFHAGKLGQPVILVAADGGPCWYCSKMVRDAYVRAHRGVSTRFDSDNQPDRTGDLFEPPKRSPTRRLGDGTGDGASASSSTSKSKSEKRAREAVDKCNSPAALLADRLRVSGFAEATAEHPAVIDAVIANVSIEVLEALRIEKPDKGLAYLVATAVGRQRDRANHPATLSEPEPRAATPYTRPVAIVETETPHQRAIAHAWQCFEYGYLTASELKVELVRIEDAFRVSTSPPLHAPSSPSAGAAAPVDPTPPEPQPVPSGA